MQILNTIEEVKLCAKEIHKDKNVKRIAIVVSGGFGRQTIAEILAGSDRYVKCFSSYTPNLREVFDVIFLGRLTNGLLEASQNFNIELEALRALPVGHLYFIKN